MRARPVPIFFIRLFILYLGLTASALASPTDVFVEKLESELLLPIIDAVPGSAIVVVVDGEVVLQKTWGVREAGSLEPITPFTVFRIASISKTFASAAASILVKETPLSWQSPVMDSVKHLNFKRRDYGHQVTLEHLMSQSTGLMPHAYTNLVEDNMPYERILKRLNRVDFVCRPGDCYGYQNVAFSLVGDVVEAETGLDYPTYVQQKLFEPLRMQRASFGRDAFLSDSNHAKPHIWTGSDWRPTRTTDHYYRIPPAAGVNASIDDMRAWLLAQLGKEQGVLNDEMLDELQRGVISTTRQQAHYRWRRGIKNVSYGLGWRVFDYKEHAGFVQHGGYVRGMRSEMVFNRELQTGMVFLTNSEPRDLGDLVFEFLDLHEQFEASTRPNLAASD